MFCDDQSGEATERDGVHSAKVGILSPHWIVIEDVRASEGAEHDKDAQERKKKPAPTKETASEGEEEVEHLFDRERPEDVPAWLGGNRFGIQED